MLTGHYWQNKRISNVFFYSLLVLFKRKNLYFYISGFFWKCLFQKTLQGEPPYAPPPPTSNIELTIISCKILNKFYKQKRWIHDLLLMQNSKVVNTSHKSVILLWIPKEKLCFINFCQFKILELLQLKEYKIMRK